MFICDCLFRPNGIEDYIHRIGRTGRAGASVSTAKHDIFLHISKSFFCCLSIFRAYLLVSSLINRIKWRENCAKFFDRHNSKCPLLWKLWLATGGPRVGPESMVEEEAADIKKKK